LKNICPLAEPSAEMIAIELDPARERQLHKLAASRQQNVATVVRQLVEDWLDVQAWEHDCEENWARASVVMAAKFLPPESWDVLVMARGEA
jgi:predicted transcriptional regulator